MGPDQKNDAVEAPKSYIPRLRLTRVVLAVASTWLLLLGAAGHAIAQSSGQPPLTPPIPHRPPHVLAPSGPTISPGRTPGSFAVSSTGAATYTIPIWGPPGPQGVQPQIALTYNSRQRNGYLGVGWSLSGLSSIYRCHPTFAQDAAPAPVTLTYADRLCLDGKRLRLTSSENLSTYGQDGTTYQTEVADFSNVTAHGTAGNGPAYFTVQGKNGWTYEYGNTTDSRVLADGTTASEWMVDKITDRAGNTMTVVYTLGDANLKGMTIPASISWAATNYKMQFTYQPLVLAPTAGYFGGQPVQNFYSLTNIQIQSSGTTIKNYVLAYAASNTTGRQTLTSVTECADAGATNCLSPTQLTYQPGQEGVGNAVTLGGSNTQGAVYAAYDFNGDGINDLAWYNQSSGTWWVAFGTSSGYSAPVNTGLTLGGNQAVIDSVDGSGMDEFLAPVNGTLYYYKWNGSSFVGTSTGTTIAVTQQGSYALADLNGDGLPDLISTGSDGYLYVQLNTTTSGSVSFSQTPIKTVAKPYSGISAGGYGSRRLDFSGSGQSDLLGYDVLKNAVWVLHFNGTTFVETKAGGISSVVDIADYNDDGCTDVLSQTTLVISACNGNPATTISLPGTAVTGFDWDGDGRQDILVQPLSGGSTLSVYKSIGTGFSTTAISTSIPFSTANVYIYSHNATGDGLDALFVFPSGAPGTVQYYLHNAAGQPPDLLSSATDGFGMQVSFTYTPLPSGAAYSGDVDSNHGGPDPTYPHSGGATLDPIYAGPLYLVSQLSASDTSDGTGGTYTDSFWYYGARMNYQGRGFDGFYAKRTLDSRNGVYTYEYYRRDFPYTGMLWETLKDQPDNATPMDTLTNTPATESLDSTQYNTRQFPYVGSSVANTYEAQGSENGELITQKTTTNGTPDIYGNFPTITVATVDKDPASPFLGNTFTQVTSQHFSYGSPSTDWCIHIPDAVSVQSTLPDNTSLTRHYGSQGNGVDYTNCRVTTDYIEAGSTTLAVTTQYTFDSFGNRQTVTVTGRNPDGTQMTPRQTTYNYGTRGLLPESVTNALNQTTQIAYNYNFGVRSQVTDPNGIVTQWTQDAFGRLQKETRPDKTTSIYTYYSCNTPPCWGVNDLRFSVFRDDYGTDNQTLIGSQGIYVDGLNHLRYVQRTHPFGTTVDEQVNYYDPLGRTHVIYQPFSSAGNGYTSFGYDLSDRKVSANIYQPNGTLDRSTIWAYTGRTTVITDPRNHNTTQVRDVMGQLRRITDPSPGTTSYYDFDPFGNLSKVTDPINAVSTATYNLRGFLTQRVDADLGKWIYNGDSLNELLSWTDANSKSFGMAYDALGRATSRTEPEGTSTWTWGSTASAHNIGQLASESGYGYSESLTYDSAGRLQTRAITTDQTYQYDLAYNPLNGAVDTLTYPAGPSSTRFKIQYGYSYLYPTTITDVTNPSSPVTLWTLSAVNDYNSATSETFGGGSAALSVSRGYKAWTDELTSIQSGVSGSTTNRQNLAYQWDVNGNLTQRQDLNQSVTEAFTPDPLNRLQSSTLNGTQNLSVTYDAAGDITNRSDVGTYSYGDSHHAHAVTAAGSYSYAYDLNGNASTRNSLTLNWASYNLPTTLQATLGGGTYSSTFSYGPDHQRYQQVATYSNGSEVTYYVGGLFEKVGGSDLQGITWYRNYVPTPSGLHIIVANSSGGAITTTYVLKDHLGSSDALVDGATGNRLVQESFAAFGQRRGSNWSGSPSSADYAEIAQITRRGFTFQEELDNIALIHMNGRVYDPNVGRFLSADPYITDPTNTQNYNRYSYVNNNPLTYIDPSGFSCRWVENPGEIIPADPSDPNSVATVVVNGAGTLECDAEGPTSPPPPEPIQLVPPSDPTPVGPPPGGGGQQTKPPQGNTPPQPCFASAASATQAGSNQVLYGDGSGNWAFATGGSRTWATNDPGAIGGRWDSAVGYYTGAGFTSPIFPNYQSGWDAFIQQWNAPRYQNQPNLNAALNTWTGKTTASNPSYFVSILSAFPAATLRLPVSELSAADMAAVQALQQQAESWAGGNVTCGSGGPFGQGPTGVVGTPARLLRPGS